MKKFAGNQRGSILLVFLITLPFLILIAIYYMSLSLSSNQVARSDQLHTEAQLTADGGADYAIQQFSQNNAWTGTGGVFNGHEVTGGEVTLHNDGSVKTTYTAAISGGDDSKTITVTGRTYWPATATTPRGKVTLNVDMRPVTSGNYSVVAGAGGLYMSNSAKIVGGDVFINGEISLDNSAQIGLSTNPVDVKVAHKICPEPANATYPRVCASGENGQPISILHTAHIYGAVQATNQTSGSGMSNPGLVAGSTVAPQDLPTYDRAAQKAAVATTITGAAASCSGSQTRIWAANTKITGNVTISNSCRVTVMGNVWITGSLAINNTAQMIVDNSLGATRPNIMVDGVGGANFSQSSQLISNSSHTGFTIYTFYSRAGCSPDCAVVTGTDLANSRSVSTITLDNSASGAQTIFYAYWSQVQLSNSGQIGAVIGQTIKLTNTATITFGSTAVAGNTVWVPTGYRRQF
jgi:hypothetical protein